MSGEIPLVKVDSLCAVDIHERDTSKDRIVFHISFSTALKSCIREISKMQLSHHCIILKFSVLLQLLELFTLLVKINNQ